MWMKGWRCVSCGNIVDPPSSASDDQPAVSACWEAAGVRGSVTLATAQPALFMKVPREPAGRRLLPYQNCFSPTACYPFLQRSLSSGTV
jgi:hypothetical protein